MVNVFYPSIEPGILELMQTFKLQMANKTYLTSKDCPYTAEQKKVLRQIFPRKGSEEAAPEAPGSGQIDLHQELLETYRLLRTLRDNFRETDVTKVGEQVQFLKAATNLLPELLALASKAEGLQNFIQFKRRLVAILREKLDDKSLTDLIQTLEAEITKND